MKKRSLQWVSWIFLMTGTLSLITFNSCKKDDDDDETPKNPIASFQFAVSSTNFLEVTFTNYSQNATSYSWDFGDGTNSTEKDPVHIYSTAGDYEVTLTAKNSVNASATYKQSISLEDPNSALAKLAGETSKTWKLYREGTSLGVGPDEAGARTWWSLSNDGTRPCVYYHEFTFTRQGEFIFDDKGYFWGEEAVFGAPQAGTCFEATAANMVNKNGADVSAWLSGTHAYEYDPVAGTITLNGVGAWIGLPQLQTNDDQEFVPGPSETFTATIEEYDGYDLLHIVFWYPNLSTALYWDFTYASYSNPALEPEVVEDQQPYGIDLPDLTPDEMWNTFETSTSFVVLDTAHANGATSAANNMEFYMGETDPAGGATPVGKYVRTGQWQELQFYMDYDIQFDNFTSVSLDVYMPSSNNYTGTLTKGIAIIIAEHSMTEQWWTGHIQFDATAEVLDEWVTYTFNLDEATSGAGELYSPHDRNDLDFFAISLGGGGHTDQGTFYIRNFKFE